MLLRRDERRQRAGLPDMSALAARLESSADAGVDGSAFTLFGGLASSARAPPATAAANNATFPINIHLMLPSCPQPKHRPPALSGRPGRSRW